MQRVHFSSITTARKQRSGLHPHLCHCDLPEGKCTFAVDFQSSVDPVCFHSTEIFYLNSVNLKPVGISLCRKNMSKQGRATPDINSPFHCLFFNLNQNFKNWAQLQKNTDSNINFHEQNITSSLGNSSPLPHFQDD